MNCKTTGEIIKEYRKKLRLTQKDVAETTGINITTICAIENNNREPNLYHLKKISTALKINGAEIGLVCNPDLSIGELIQYHREINGFSQSELAQKAGLSFGAIRYGEKNERMFSASELLTIIETLNISDKNEIQQFYAAYEKANTEFLNSEKGNKIKLIRKIKGLNNIEAAEQVGISVDEFSKIQNGKKYRNKKSKQRMADKISSVLGLDAEEVLECL